MNSLVFENDEGRSKLRKVLARRKRPLNQEFPNVNSYQLRLVILTNRGPAELKHLSKRRKGKQIAISLVAASEKEKVQVE